MKALSKISECQDLAFRILSGAFKKERVASAYLFYGPEGSGKKLAALQFAKTLICKNAGCENCIDCKRIESMSHPDLFFLGAGADKKTPEKEKNSIGIDEIRELQRNVCLKSFESDFKVCVIDQCERMTENASNSFLKLLEEPPEKTIFILISASIQALPLTIISRCQPVRFFKPTKKNYKQEVLEKEFSDFRSDGFECVLRQMKEKVEGRNEAVEFMDFLLLLYREVLFAKELDCENMDFPEYKDDLMFFFQGIEKKRIIESIDRIFQTRRMIYKNANQKLVLDALFMKLF